MAEIFYIQAISDALRGLLDGHIWLSRNLAARGHYPAVDILGSLSRLMPEVTSPEHLRAALAVRDLLAAYRDHEDLISIGAYRRGSNPRVDLAIEMQEPIRRYLCQAMGERSTLEQAQRGLMQLWQRMESRAPAAGPSTGASAPGPPS